MLPGRRLISRSTAAFLKAQSWIIAALIRTLKTWSICSTNTPLCHIYTPTTLSSMTAANLTTLTDCALDCRVVHDIISWCMSHRLQLNASKTEALWVGSKSSLAKLYNRECSIHIGTSTIQPSTVVRDLGIHLDSELSMKQHISRVSASCFYHLRRLRQILRRVGCEVATRLVQALVLMSRLGYYNLMLAGLPQTTIAPIASDFWVGTREHVTANLFQLHWLAGPVQAVLSHALNLLWKVPGLFEQHREPSQLRSFSSWFPIFVVDRLLTATATYQVWRARFHLRRPVGVELSTRGLECCLWSWTVQKTT